MLRRIAYTLCKAPQYRAQLSHIKQQPPISPDKLSLDRWKEKGIKTLIFDFDGVLASHGEDVPNSVMRHLLQQSTELFGNEHVFILSNKPSAIRAEYFAKHFEHIQFIRANRKKPYPDGIEKIIELSKSKPEQILLVDDRLLTGALAACISGIRCQYIAEPLMNKQKRPVVETFFHGLRIIERILLYNSH